MSKTYEMMWDCSYCGTKKLLGQSHKHCPNCGTAQDPTKRYFPPDEEKVAVEDHQFVGKDKVCGFCEAPNSALANFCTECAGPLDGSKEVKLVEEHPPAVQTSQTQAKTKPNKRSFKGIIFTILAVLLVIVVILSMTKEKGVTVTGHSWQRSIEVEQYKQVEEEAWDDRVPTSGRIKQCRQKERDTEKVPDGEECSLVKKDNGDGTYNESEKCTTKYKTIPIYDDWCTYEIKKWVVARTDKESAQDLNPIWPTPTIRTCPTTSLNCEREGERRSVYTIHLKDEDGTEHECSFPEADWKGITVGTQRTMEFGQVTGNIDCDSWNAE